MIGYLLFGSLTLGWWAMSTITSLTLSGISYGVTCGYSYLTGSKREKTIKDLEQELTQLKTEIYRERLKRISQQNQVPSTDDELGR